MPYSRFRRQADLARLELWLIKLEAERPWRYRLLVVGVGLLLFSVCGLLSLVLHP